MTGSTTLLLPTSKCIRSRPTSTSAIPSLPVEVMTVDPVPPARLGQPIIIDVCIDVNDLATMGPFWETLLGYQRSFEREGHLYLVDPSGLGPHIYLQTVPEPRHDK